MIDTATLPPVPVARKCRIEEIFDPAFLELLQLVPANPHVRALILKLTGKMPGQDCVTFDQLKEWVEANCEKKVQPSPGRSSRGIPNDGISVQVEFSETEYGRADYSVRCSGSGEFRIGGGELSELVQAAIEAGDGIDGIVELVAGKIDENAWNQCEPDMDSNGDYDYSDHDMSSTDDNDTSYSKGDIRDAVLAFVRERHPELAAEL